MAGLKVLSTSSKATRFRFKSTEDELLLETVIPLVQDDIQTTSDEFWKGVLENLRSENPRFNLCTERTLHDHINTLMKGHITLQAKELNDSKKEYTLTRKCILLNTLIESWSNYEEMVKLEKAKKKFKQSGKNCALGWPSGTSPILDTPENNRVSEAALNRLVVTTLNDEASGEEDAEQVTVSTDTGHVSGDVPKLPKKRTKSQDQDPWLEYLKEKHLSDNSLEEKRLKMTHEIEQQRLQLESRRLDIQERQMAIDEQRLQAELNSKDMLLKQQSIMTELLLKVAEKQN